MVNVRLKTFVFTQQYLRDLEKYLVSLKKMADVNVRGIAGSGGAQPPARSVQFALAGSGAKPREIFGILTTT